MSRNPQQQQQQSGAQPAGRQHTHSAPPHPMYGVQGYGHPPYYAQGGYQYYAQPQAYQQMAGRMPMQQPLRQSPQQGGIPAAVATQQPPAATAPRATRKKKSRNAIAIVDPNTQKPIDLPPLPEKEKKAPAAPSTTGTADSSSSATAAAPAATAAATGAAAPSTAAAPAASEPAKTKPEAAAADKSTKPRSKAVTIKSPSGTIIDLPKPATTASAPATPISNKPPQSLEAEIKPKKDAKSAADKAPAPKEDRKEIQRGGLRDIPGPDPAKQSQSDTQQNESRGPIEYPEGTYNPKTNTPAGPKRYARSFLLLFREQVRRPPVNFDGSANKQVKAVQKTNKKKTGGVVPDFLSSEFAPGRKIKSNVSTQSIKRPNFDVKPLEKSENRWKASTLDPTEKVALSENEAALKKARGVLNRLTLDKFDKLSDQLIDIGKSLPEEMVNSFVEEVFIKAIDEPFFSRMYAQLCAKMSQKDAVPSFRKFLLNNCQKEFEKDRQAEVKEAEKSSEKGEKEEKTKQEIEEEEYKQLKAKLHMLGNIKFIGELFLTNMVSENIIYKNCIDHLLKESQKTGDDEVVECLCQLLETAGSKLEPNPAAKQVLQDRFNTLKRLADPKAPKKLSSRIRFRIQDVVELRERGWKVRREQAGPKTIKEVHKEAQKAKDAAAVQRNNDRNSRDRGYNNNRNDRNERGSRQGGRRSHQNNNNNNSGDGWQVQSKQAKIDPKRLGIKSNKSQTTSFKPQSFAAQWGKGSSGGKKDEGTPKKATPSRNQFAALNDDDDDDDEEDDDDIEEDVEDEEDEGVELSEDEKKEIHGFVDEFIGTFNEKEAIECIQEFCKKNDVPPTYPSAYFVECAITQSLEAKLEVSTKVGQLFAKLFDMNILTPETFAQGTISPIDILEDVCIDAPKAIDIFAALFAKGMAVGNVSLDALKTECLKNREDGSPKMYGDTPMKVALKTLKALEREWKSQQQVLDVVKGLSFAVSEFLPENQRDRFEDLLDRNDLKYLNVPTSSKSNYDDMVEALSGGDESKLESWISSNISKGEVDGAFVADLSKAIVAHISKTVLGDDVTRKPSQAETEKELKLFKTFKAILHKYSHGGKDLTVSVLNGVQSYASDNNFPPAMLHRWFSILYDEDTVEESGFLEWKGAVDAGKAKVALSQLESFFKSLDEGEEETDA